MSLALLVVLVTDLATCPEWDVILRARLADLVTVLAACRLTVVILRAQWVDLVTALATCPDVILPARLADLAMESDAFLLQFCLRSVRCLTATVMDTNTVTVLKSESASKS